MLAYDIYQAQKHFLKLVNLVLKGKIIIITKAGAPVAKLVPYKK